MPEFLFDTTSTFIAGAKGEPGQRTFYLIVEQPNRWVRIWLEKQQLLGVGEAITQALASQPGSAVPPTFTDDPPGSPVAEFHAQQIGLAEDDSQDALILVFQGAQDGQTVTVQAWGHKPPLRGLAQRIEEVGAAGRPICPLCGQPMDPAGHTCIRTNGHLH